MGGFFGFYLDLVLYLVGVMLLGWVAKLLAVSLIALFSPLFALSEGWNTTPVAATTTSPMNAYYCVEYVGYNPDNFILVYQHGRGRRWVTTAETAARRKGVGVTKVGVDLLKDHEIQLLQCFYGKYTPGSREFVGSPRLLCPKTGEVKELYQSQPVMKQLRVFAQNCK